MTTQKWQELLQKTFLYFLLDVKSGKFLLEKDKTYLHDLFENKDPDHLQLEEDFDDYQKNEGLDDLNRNEGMQNLIMDDQSYRH